MSSNYPITNPCSLSFNPSFEPPFGREQKLEIVRRILFGGERISAVARALDLDVKVIARWRREYQRDPERAFPTSFAARALTLTTLDREKNTDEQ